MEQLKKFAVYDSRVGRTMEIRATTKDMAIEHGKMLLSPLKGTVKAYRVIN